MSRIWRIALLPGDGVGPEVAAAARTVLEAIAEAAGIGLMFETAPVGGAALETTGSPLPEETVSKLNHIFRRVDSVSGQ